MTGYQYKTVAAPRRLKKVKGVRGKDALLAHAVEDLIAVETAQGWEYLRADSFPVEDKGGLFSKPVVTERAVLVFRKAIPAHQPVAQPQPAPQPAAQPAPPQRAEPSVAPAPEAPRAPTVGGAND